MWWPGSRLAGGMMNLPRIRERLMTPSCVQDGGDGGIALRMSRLGHPANRPPPEIPATSCASNNRVLSGRRGLTGEIKPNPPLSGRPMSLSSLSPEDPHKPDF